MYKSLKQRIILDKERHQFVVNLMHISKNLYNEALYNVRQHFFNEGKYIEVIYTYRTKKAKAVKISNKEIMGIDLGYKNLATCATTNNNPLLIDGNGLKSYNVLYHKQIAKLASFRQNQNVLTNKMIRTIDKRNRRIDYGINKAARIIINHAINNQVGLIIIGYNKTFKSEALSKRYNQWTKTIPIARLRDRIIYLAEENQIETIIVNEAYTSLSSYLDQDKLTKTDFSGKRVKRGLYQSGSGHLINADLNAAFNILRKGNPDAKWIGISGLNTPKRTYLFS